MGTNYGVFRLEGNYEGNEDTLSEDHRDCSTTLHSLTPFPKYSIYGAETNMTCFYNETSALMHAFGDIPCPNREAVRLMQDIVRDLTARLSRSAHRHAVREHLQTLGTTHPEVATLRRKHIDTCFEQDEMAFCRLASAMTKSKKSYPTLVGELKYDHMKIRNPLNRNRALSLSDLNSDPLLGPFQRRTPPRQMLVTKIHAIAHFLLKQSSTPEAHHKYESSRAANFVLGETNSSIPQLSGKPRLFTFQNWLDLQGAIRFPITAGALCALGHVAWEAVGIVTQVALLEMHFEKLRLNHTRRCTSIFDLSTQEIASALSHGLGHSLIFPLSEQQMHELWNSLSFHYFQFLNTYPFNTSEVSHCYLHVNREISVEDYSGPKIPEYSEGLRQERLRNGFERARARQMEYSKGIQPKHIREAYRKMMDRMNNSFCRQYFLLKEDVLHQ